uniref:Uncharacterized protein n=1 Tax=Cacopsylla melanoneura TaxID=428564 RepID=A0A8D8WLU1_9HEMI
MIPNSPDIQIYVAKKAKISPLNDKYINHTQLMSDKNYATQVKLMELEEAIKSNTSRIETIEGKHPNSRPSEPPKQNSTESTFSTNNTTTTNKTKSVMKKTCTVIGDSHVRDFHKYLQETGNDKYSYHVQCNPGKSLTHLKNEFSSSLDQDDCLVLFGGTNDIFHTPWTQLENYLFSFLQKNCTKLRIVVVGIPYRYNTPAANTHIKRLNAKIRLVVNIFKNSVFLDTNKRINKKDYLNDKLHLNKIGKLKLCTSLNKVIENDNIFLEKNKGMKKAHTKKRDENVPSENKMKHYENKKTLEILNVSDSNSDKNNRFIAHEELTSKRKNTRITQQNTDPMIVDLINVQNTQNSYQTNKSKVTRNPKPHRTSPQLSGHQDTVRVQHVPVISYNHQSEQETIRTSTTQPVDPHPQSEPAYTLHKEQEHTMPPIGQLRGSNPGPQTTAPTPCKQTGQTQSMPHPVQLQASNLVPAHYQLPHPAYRVNGYYNTMIPITQAASSQLIDNAYIPNNLLHHQYQSRGLGVPTLPLQCNITSMPWYIPYNAYQAMSLMPGSIPGMTRSLPGVLTGSIPVKPNF